MTTTINKSALTFTLTLVVAVACLSNHVDANKVYNIQQKNVEPICDIRDMVYVTLEKAEVVDTTTLPTNGTWLHRQIRLRNTSCQWYRGWNTYMTLYNVCLTAIHMAYMVLQEGILCCAHMLVVLTLFPIAICCDTRTKTSVKRKQNRVVCDAPEKVANDCFQLFCRLQFGGNTSTIVLDVRENESIAVLKQKIQRKCGIPVCKQRLEFGGKPLDNDGTLLRYGIRSESTVVVMLRLLGGRGLGYYKERIERKVQENPSCGVHYDVVVENDAHFSLAAKFTTGTFKFYLGGRAHAEETAVLICTGIAKLASGTKQTLNGSEACVRQFSKCLTTLLRTKLGTEEFKREYWIMVNEIIVRQSTSSRTAGCNTAITSTTTTTTTIVGDAKRQQINGKRRQSTRCKIKVLPPDINKNGIEVIDLTNEENCDKDTTVHRSKTSLNKIKDKVVADGMGSINQKQNESSLDGAKIKSTDNLDIGFDDTRDCHIKDDSIGNTDNNDSVFNRQQNNGKRRQSTRCKIKVLPPDINKNGIEVIDLTNEENCDKDTTVHRSKISLNKIKDKVVADGMGSINQKQNESSLDGAKIKSTDNLDIGFDDTRDCHIKDDSIGNTDNNDSVFNRPYYIFSMNRWWEGSANSLESGAVRIKYTNNTFYTYRTAAEFIADINEYKTQGDLKWKDAVSDEEKQQLSNLAMQKRRKKKAGGKQSTKKTQIDIGEVRKISKQWKPVCIKDEQCMICLDYGSDYSLKGCGHVFHWGCIKKEMQTDRPKKTNKNMQCREKCPICRNPILGNTKSRAGDSYTSKYSQKEEINIDEDAINNYVKAAKTQRDLVKKARRQGNRARKKANARVIQYNSVTLNITPNGSRSSVTTQNKHAQQQLDPSCDSMFDTLVNAAYSAFNQTEDKKHIKRTRQNIEAGKTHIASSLKRKHPQEEKHGSSKRVKSNDLTEQQVLTPLQENNEYIEVPNTYVNVISY